MDQIKLAYEMAQWIIQSIKNCISMEWWEDENWEGGIDDRRTHLYFRLGPRLRLIIRIRNLFYIKGRTPPPLLEWYGMNLNKIWGVRRSELGPVWLICWAASLIVPIMARPEWYRFVIVTNGWLNGGELTFWDSGTLLVILVAMNFISFHQNHKR